jgi:hypothetical protein
MDDSTTPNTAETPVAPTEPVAPAETPTPTDVPAGPSETPVAPVAPAPKKSNTGLIVGIIIAAIVVIGGGIAAALIIPNLGGSNNGGGSSNGGGSNNGGNQEVNIPVAENDASYFVKIDGKEYNYRSKLSEVEESGYKLSDAVRSKSVDARKYLIMIGGGTMTDKSTGVYFDFVPYNDGDNKVSFPEAMLGSVTVEKNSDAKKQAVLESIEFVGGIHLGSSREDLIAAFGEPTSTREQKASTGTYEIIEFKDKTWKKFEFNVQGGVITEMKWTNYGDLNN